MFYTLRQKLSITLPTGTYLITNVLCCFINIFTCYTFTLLCVESSVAIKTYISLIRCKFTNILIHITPFLDHMELYSPHRVHSTARTCFVTDNARKMINRIVQSSYYSHFFELEAHEPFSVNLIFHMLQQ